MAQRLATEYVKASLRLSEAQMSQFIHKVNDPHVRQCVKILDGGGQEVVLEDEDGEGIHLPFDRLNGFYVCEASFRLVNPHLTNVIRRLFAAFKGSGLVNRIYDGFTMMYYYEMGRIQKIVEHTESSYTIVYEYKNTIGELQRLFNANDIEREIVDIQHQINELLDLRLVSQESKIKQIDQQLRQNTKRLFALEA